METGAGFVMDDASLPYGYANTDIFLKGQVNKSKKYVFINI